MTDPSNPTLRGVFFDLDGTLVDTAVDMGAALNLQRQAHGLEELDFALIRPQVSHGAPALMKLGFGLSHGDTDFDPMRRQFLETYARIVAQSSRPFSGIDELLTRLENAGILWGVVTNKPAFLTDALLSALAMTHRAAAVISGDTLALRKPHPAPLLEACRRAGVAPWQCVYVGDARRDIEAGHNAGMKTITAAYGYIDEAENTETWAADATVMDAAGIWPLLESWR